MYLSRGIFLSTSFLLFPITLLLLRSLYLFVSFCLTVKLTSCLTSLDLRIKRTLRKLAPSHHRGTVFPFCTHYRSLSPLRFSVSLLFFSPASLSVTDGYALRSRLKRYVLWMERDRKIESVRGSIPRRKGHAKSRRAGDFKRKQAEIAVASVAPRNLCLFASLCVWRCFPQRHPLWSLLVNERALKFYESAPFFFDNVEIDKFLYRCWSYYLRTLLDVHKFLRLAMFVLFL